MTNTDKSIHDICIASIKRSTIKPYDFIWTKFYEANAEFTYSDLQINSAETELFICSTIVDTDNYSVLTTRRLISKQDGQFNIAVLAGAVDQMYGDFKDYKEKKITLGQVQLQNGIELKYLIETGNASMVMIQGIRTMLRTQQMTGKQIENTVRNWDKQDEKNSR